MFDAETTLPCSLQNRLRRLQLLPTRFVLAAEAARQSISLFEREPLTARHVRTGTFRISTSRFGFGQTAGSNQTPLGLHRIGAKVGGGYPPGTIFQSRQATGLTWAGGPDAPIAHRILWLEGLEPGFNSGGDVDSFRRYIYIHGVGNELTLGRPASRGCLHLAAKDLIPLFDRIPVKSMVWIE